MKIRIKIERHNLIETGMTTLYIVQYYHVLGGWNSFYNIHRSMRFLHRAEAEEWVRLFKAVCGKKVRVVKSK